MYVRAARAVDLRFFGCRRRAGSGSVVVVVDRGGRSIEAVSDDSLLLVPSLPDTVLCSGGRGCLTQSLSMRGSKTDTFEVCSEGYKGPCVALASPQRRAY